MILVAFGDGGRVEIGAQQTLARTRLLDFGDDRGLAGGDACANGVDEAARARRGLRAASQFRQRQTCAALGDFLALAREDFLQDVRWTVHPVTSLLLSAASASSLARAAPLATTPAACFTPASRLGTRPAT